MKNYRIAAICFLSAVSLAACSPAGTDVSFPNTIQVENGESQSTIEVSRIKRPLPMPSAPKTQILLSASRKIPRR